MKKDKKFLALIIVLIILISTIVYLVFNIKSKSTFSKPSFELNASTEIPNNIDYESSIIKVKEGYSIYINGIPKIEKNYLNINFISIEDNNVWIKIRVLDEEENIIGESGLIKPGEYLKNIKLNKKLKEEQNITYKIIGYEINSYMSAGTIELNTKVGI